MDELSRYVLAQHDLKSNDKEQHNMSKNKPAYDFYSFLKSKKPHEYSKDETDLVVNEVEKVGHRIDSGVFRDNPHLLGMLGQRLMEEAARRMGISTDPLAGDNQASPDGTTDQSAAPKAPQWKPGLFRD